MTDQLSVLLRVKNLKEEQALLDANARRAQAERAAAATARAKELVLESGATLEARHDSVYREIIGKIVRLDAIEETKARSVAIDKEHNRLVDAQERAVHVQAEADAARDAAVQLHRQALKNVDKYRMLIEAEREKADAVAEQREEIDVEDLFGTKRRGLS